MTCECVAHREMRISSTQPTNRMDVKLCFTAIRIPSSISDVRLYLGSNPGFNVAPFSVRRRSIAVSVVILNTTLALSMMTT